MIAVVKNGRNVYLQPAVKVPLVRFMPTLGLQQPAPFLPRAHQYPPHYIRIPQMDDISDRKFGEYKMSIGKLGTKVGCNVQPFSSPHVEHVHMGVCVCAVINARVCVCVLHISSTFTPFKHSCQDRTTHSEELLTPWSHLQVMAANMLWVIRYVFQPLWPLSLFPLFELCYWFKSSDPE